jgi:hypothetical protein
MNRRGYALYVALLLVGMAGVVFAATMSLLKTDLARTNAEVTQAQLRQLLLAGEASAYVELSKTGTLKDRPVALPPELTGATATLRVDKSTADRVEARVLADYLQAKQEQSLVYTRRDAKWSLESAILP